jgi:arylsulfatase A-like enzyme
MRNSENTEKDKPNILFIAVDDMKTDLGCYGNRLVKTPNLDQLAEKGAIFSNNYCQQAVCGPSRASLLTGRYPDEIKVWGFYSIRERNPGIVTLPQHFKNNGYTTVNISKIFDQRTVDEYWDSLSWNKAFPLSEEALVPYFSEESGPVVTYFYQSPLVKEKFQKYRKEALEKDLHPIRYTQNFIKPATECLEMPDDAYKDGVFAKKAMIDLEELAGEEKPFFLAVGFERPHLPWTAPKKYWDLYDRDSFQLEEFRDFASGDSSWFYTSSNELRTYTDERGNRIYEGLSEHIPLPENEQKRLIHAYYAAVSYIDAQIGKILAKLEELELEKNTIVVIWGDHGWHLGDHGIWGKSTNFEQATRSPMIISVPGRNGRKIQHLTGFVDLYPSLCDLAGIEIPADLAGRSLKKLIFTGQDDGHDYAFSQFSRDEKMGYAIRDKRYRYVEWIEEGRHVDPEADYSKVVARQLFDYQTDPSERRNIANQESISEVQKRLADELRVFYERYQRRNDE